MREINLKLWILVVAYAAGIAFGAKMLSVDSIRTLSLESIIVVSVAGSFTVLAAVALSFIWAGKRSNPQWGTAYGLLIVVFLAAGVTGGLCSTSSTGGDQPAGAGQNLNVGTTDLDSTGESSREQEPAAGATGSRMIGGLSGNNGSGEKGVKKLGSFDTEAMPVIKAVRKHLKGTIKKTISARYQGLMTGIVLGETQDIPQDMEADFKATGLSHILAVSGLNISILIIAFGYLVRAATINMEKAGRILAFVISAGAVVFYMFLTNLQPSVVRAGVMGLAALVAILAARRGNPFPALAAAAMVILVVDPAALFNIGFQLSFAATVAILIFTPQLETAFKVRPGGVGSAACLTLAAQLGVAPLLILYFGQLSTVSIAANVIVGPAIPLATILGIVITLCGAISMSMAQIVALMTKPCLVYIAGAANYFAGWPYSSLSLPPVSVWHVAVYYLLLGLFYIVLTGYSQWQSNRATINDFPNRRFARTVTASILLATLVIGLFGCQAVKSQSPAGLRAVFIDVGQGDATLIQAEDGATILIDGGPEPDSALAVLRAYGIKAIDLLIMTHAHADHASGLEPVVDRYLIKKAVLPAPSSTGSLNQRIINTLKQNGVSGKTGKQGQSYAVGKFLNVSIIAPDEAMLNAAGTDESDDANNRAIVAIIRYKEVKMLLTGDIELSTEEAMVNDREVEHVDVLKVPHHGSKNGADERFIKAVHPEIAVISAGLNNPFHHPAPSTLTKLMRAGAAVYRTDKNGSVIIESDGSTIHVSTSKQ